jgi:predicted nucleotidyltransferase
MVRNVDQDGLLELVCNRIVPAFDPLRIILFGSRARGDARPDSDVDLLVVLQSVDDKRARAIDIRQVLRDLPVGKDIIVTTPEEIAARGDVIGSVLRPALREGRTVYERS